MKILCRLGKHYWSAWYVIGDHMERHCHYCKDTQGREIKPKTIEDTMTAEDEPAGGQGFIGNMGDDSDIFGGDDAGQDAR